MKLPEISQLHLEFFCVSYASELISFICKPESAHVSPKTNVFNFVNDRYPGQARLLIERMKEEKSL